MFFFFFVLVDIHVVLFLKFYNIVLVVIAVLRDVGQFPVTLMIFMKWVRNLIVTFYWSAWICLKKKIIYCWFPPNFILCLFCISMQREKKNLQDLNGIYVFSVAEREYLDRPTARLIKEFDCIEGKPSLWPWIVCNHIWWHSHIS